MPDGIAAYDIGPASADRFAREIQKARTIFWNGPMGVYETPPFDAGTKAVAQAVAVARARSVIGGGETTAALDRFGRAAHVFHVSTGGGASLALLAGEGLMALAVLDDT